MQRPTTAVAMAALTAKRAERFPAPGTASMHPRDHLGLTPHASPVTHLEAKPPHPPSAEMSNVLYHGPRLGAPKLLVVDCRTVTLGWTVAGDILNTAASSPTVALFYAVKGADLNHKASATKPWSLGLHSNRATVTGLWSNTLYAFTVSAALAEGGWSVPSDPLEVRTMSTCEAPKLSGHPDCHAGSLTDEVFAPVFVLKGDSSSWLFRM